MGKRVDPAKIRRSAVSDLGLHSSSVLILSVYRVCFAILLDYLSSTLGNCYLIQLYEKFNVRILNNRRNVMLLNCKQTKVITLFLSFAIKIALCVDPQILTCILYKEKKNI